MTSKLPYRSGVGIMMLNNENKVFVAKRIDTKAEAWQMPQGGVDKGETPEEAALRELKEETGTDKATIIARAKKEYTYDLPDELIPKIWNGKFRGQKQHWFVLRFTGRDADIDINTPEPEFNEWKWAKPQQVPLMIVPFKRALYEALIAEFDHYLHK